MRGARVAQLIKHGRVSRSPTSTFAAMVADMRPPTDDDVPIALDRHAAGYPGQVDRLSRRDQRSAGRCGHRVPADSPHRLDPERIIAVLGAHGCGMRDSFAASARELHGAHRQTLDIDIVPRSNDATPHPPRRSATASLAPLVASSSSVSVGSSQAPERRPL